MPLHLGCVAINIEADKPNNKQETIDWLSNFSSQVKEVYTQTDYTSVQFIRLVPNPIDDQESQKQNQDSNAETASAKLKKTTDAENIKYTKPQKLKHTSTKNKYSKISQHIKNIKENPEMEMLVFDTNNKELIDKIRMSSRHGIKFVKPRILNTDIKFQPEPQLELLPQEVALYKKHTLKRSADKSDTTLHLERTRHIWDFLFPDPGIKPELIEIIIEQLNSGLMHLAEHKVLGERLKLTITTKEINYQGTKLFYAAHECCIPIFVDINFDATLLALAGKGSLYKHILGQMLGIHDDTIKADKHISGFLNQNLRLAVSKYIKRCNKKRLGETLSSNLVLLNLDLCHIFPDGLESILALIWPEISINHKYICSITMINPYEYKTEQVRPSHMPTFTKMSFNEIIEALKALSEVLINQAEQMSSMLQCVICYSPIGFKPE